MAGVNSVYALLDKLKLETISDDSGSDIDEEYPNPLSTGKEYDSNLDIDGEYPNPLSIGKEYDKADIPLWPNAEVFYKFDSSVSYSMRQSIKKAIEDFSAKTPVLWTPHTNQQYYVMFIETASGSSSSVGCTYLKKKNNKAVQNIKICGKEPYGTVIHEMCHALGMRHEHARADRDDYVKCIQIVHKNGDILYITPDNVNFKRSKTPPLGQYDFDSVLHYCEIKNDETEGIKLELRDPSYRRTCTVGQRINFSTKDLEKIDILYGSEVCTFDRFGEHYRPVKWYFQCVTCWGKVSHYGCCLYCAYKCHKPLKHILKKYRTEPGIVFVCDCGRNSHTIPMCTLLSTGAKKVKQTWYHCYDCFNKSEQRCCYACSKMCHKFHNVTVISTTYSTCDCGIESFCKFSGDMERLCTKMQCSFDRFTELHRSCVYYECYTCWGDNSNYGCCTYCANNHHRGHNLNKTSSSRFVCDCGRYRHEIPMCTLLSSGPIPVQQNWYHCSDCFNDPKLGCCYACSITCHKSHSIYKMGNASSTCNCGVTPRCKLSCHSSIEKIVTQKMCSFDRFQDHYMPMTWYECYTCWGGKSNFGCCSFCINNHHKGHSVVKHDEDATRFFCDCGKIEHKQPCCTWVATKKTFVMQPWYICHDCFPLGPADYGCCYACAMNCHAGHRVYFVYISTGAFCDCGFEYCKIKCKISS